MSTTYSPAAWSSPADIATSIPKLRDSCTRTMPSSRPASSSIRAAEASLEPSSTNTSSWEISPSAERTRRCSSGRTASSSSTGMTTETVGTRCGIVCSRAGGAMIALRTALVLLALAAGGWLAVQERAAHAQEEIDAIAFAPRSSEPGAAELARARPLLRTYRRLNPDHRPDLAEAVLLGRAGRDADAVALLRRSVAAEPESLEAWALLASAAKSVDPALAARARLRVLAPPEPGE